MTTHTFKVGDRVRRSGAWVYPVGTVLESHPGRLVVSWDGSAEDAGNWYLDDGYYETTLVEQPPTSPHTTRLLSALRSAGMHIAEATDHATRALSGEPGQVKNRHEVMSSAIANAARACAEAAYELGMEYVGRRT